MVAELSRLMECSEEVSMEIRLFMTWICARNVVPIRDVVT